MIFNFKTVMHFLFWLVIGLLANLISQVITMLAGFPIIFVYLIGFIVTLPFMNKALNPPETQ